MTGEDLYLYRMLDDLKQAEQLLRYEISHYSSLSKSTLQLAQYNVDRLHALIKVYESEEGTK